MAFQKTENVTKVGIEMKKTIGIGVKQNKSFSQGSSKSDEKKDSFDARLWRIGGSIVFTLPSELQARFEGDFVETTITIGSKSMTYLMMPWKCGGSFVITVPKQYVLAYKLGSIIKDKEKVGIGIKSIRQSGG
jgi:hypothetical protein